MNNNGHMKLTMSIGLALLLVVQTFFFLRLKPDIPASVGLLLGLIILLALVAVFFSYWRMKKVEKRVDGLPQDYRNFYIDANEAIGLSSMKHAFKKDTMDMILEILEHAHAEKRPLADVIGNDASSYIGGFISASGGAMTPMYLFGYSSATFILYLLMIKAYKVFQSGGGRMEDLSQQTLDMGIVLTYGLIAFIFFPWVLITMQKAAKNQWSGFRRLWILVPFIIPIGLMSLLIFIENPGFRSFMDRPLPIFSNIWFIIAGILMAVSGFILSNYSRKRAFRRTLNQ